MPYPNEHSARLKDPKQYDEFRRENNKFGSGIHAIWGIKIKDGTRTSELQAIRFDAKKFTTAEAKAWLKEHDEFDVILFEPATGEGKSMEHEELRRAVATFASVARSKEQRGREERTFAGTEIRAQLEGDKPKLEGYAAKFDVRSQELPGFVEIVRPGAFTKTISEADVRALWDHKSEFVLGRKSNRTLELREDDVGLAVTIYPPETPTIQDLCIGPIDRGDVSEMSFAFRTIKDRFSSNEDGETLRELIEVELLDVSPVTFPAYPQTEIALRAMLECREMPTDPIVDFMGRLTDEDRARTLMALKAAFGSVPEQQPGPQVELLRRRLELAELE